MGADLFVTHYRHHDVEQPWGADDLRGLIYDLTRGASGRVADMSADLAEASAAHRIIESAVETFGHVDISVCNQARVTLLLSQLFARQHDGRRGARVVWLTSGQQLGPMRGEVGYAANPTTRRGSSRGWYRTKGVGSSGR